MDKKIFNIEGMTCAACVRSVEKATSKIDGVDKVSVNLITNRMEVQFDEQKTSISSIEDSVDRKSVV